MFAQLVILFVVTPIVELALLLKLAQITDWTYALGLVIVTGVVGGALAKHQGIAVWRRINAELAQGRLPGQAMVEGLFVLVGAVLLVTPGLLTDAFGMLCLIPWTRALMARRLRERYRSRLVVDYQPPPPPENEDDWLPG